MFVFIDYFVCVFFDFVFFREMIYMQQGQNNNQYVDKIKKFLESYKIVLNASYKTIIDALDKEGIKKTPFDKYASYDTNNKANHNKRITGSYAKNKSTKFSPQLIKTIIAISAFLNKEEPLEDIDKNFFDYKFKDTLNFSDLKNCESWKTLDGCLSPYDEHEAELYYKEAPDKEPISCNKEDCPIYVLFHEFKKLGELEDCNKEQRKELIKCLREDVFLKELKGKNGDKISIPNKPYYKTKECEKICENLYNNFAMYYINPMTKYVKVVKENYDYSKLSIEIYKILYYTSALMKTCNYDETKRTRIECNKITAFIRLSKIPFISYECNESFLDVIKSCEELIERCSNDKNKYELTIELFGLLVYIMCWTTCYDKEIRDKIIRLAEESRNFVDKLFKKLDTDADRDRFRKLRIKNCLNYCQLLCYYCGPQNEMERLLIDITKQDSCNILNISCYTVSEFKGYYEEVPQKIQSDFLLLYFFCIYVNHYEKELFKNIETNQSEIGKYLSCTFIVDNNCMYSYMNSFESTDKIESETFIDYYLNDPIFLIKNITLLTGDSKNAPDSVCKSEDALLNKSPDCKDTVNDLNRRDHKLFS